MDIIVQLNNQTAGRDKIIRLLQYCARAGWYYSQNDRRRTAADVLKMLRFGRCLDGVYLAINAMKYPDPAVRLTTSMSRLSNALFLLADHIIWLSRAGLTRINLEKWTSVSHRYWLMSIIFNLTRDLYEFMEITRKRSGEGPAKIRSSKSLISRRMAVLGAIAERSDLVLDTVKNGCDLFIPLSALGYARLSPGAVGLLGACSSAIGIYCLACPLYKLPGS